MNSNIDIPVERLNEPGNIWIRPQNKQLRYGIDSDDKASWVIPLPVYTASTEVKAGQPVSMADYSQEHTISKNNSRDRTIVPTNSLINSHFIGIALDYGDSKNQVHIQNNGEIVYEMSNRNNPKYALPPYHKQDDNFVFDWTDADVGSTVYINHDGGFTLNVDEVSGGNIMSVGKLVFAPKTSETKERQQRIIIHIQAGGDDRGVQDTAQFTIQMSPTSTTKVLESNYDRILFVKINDKGLGEFILNDDAITKDINASPVGAIVVKSIDGICSLLDYIGKKITVTRLGLVSGNFGFKTSNIGKIGLINDGKVDFTSAADYSIKVGIFKSYKDDLQDFLVDCRFPVETSSSGDKIGNIKPVFGSNEEPLLDIGYALVDNSIHRVSFIKNDKIDLSGIDWTSLITSCYSKDIFEFGRKINGEYVFSRYLEEINGKAWSPDVYDTDTTLAIFSPETFFKFRNLYYTISKADGSIAQVACQIKFTQDSLNTNEECIWPEEAYKIILKADSDKENYVVGGKGQESTLFCNISRLVNIGNYMDSDGSNIESYDITVKSQSTGRIVSPGFYQNKDGKWCGYEWYLYSNNGVTYLYMSTIPAGVSAKDCNGLCITRVGDKQKIADPAETLIVTVRRRPTLYNAVYLNQYPKNNPWMPYIDGNTGNLITENTIYFGSPNKLLKDNKTNDEDASSGNTFNETGRNGKIELTTENSGKIINLSTQVRGSTNNPVFKDKKQAIKNDGSVSNTIEWEYDFTNMVTSLNSYFAPTLISKKSNILDVSLDEFSYVYDDDTVSTSDIGKYIKDRGYSAIEILDSYIFRNIKYNSDSKANKSTISIVAGDDSEISKYLFEERKELDANRYTINKDNYSEYKDLLYIDNSYINYMSLLSLIGLSVKDLYLKDLKLERIIYGSDFNNKVATLSSFADNSLDYINNIGLLREIGYLNNSLVLAETNHIKAEDLGTAYLPNKGYFSIVDRFVIEDFYDYNDIEDFTNSYLDYTNSSFTERFNKIVSTSMSRGSNLAQLYITYKDLGYANYTYDIYDYFKFLDEKTNVYDVPLEAVREGSFIEASNIVFVKNTRGYSSLCRPKVKYSQTNIKTDAIETREVYEICDEPYDATQTYYQNVGIRKYNEIKVEEYEYSPNKYYIKKTVDAKYSGYPFMWPLSNDTSFSDLDFEYNFFSKKTYGLDDSVSIFDNNDDRNLRSFSSQSLEGITFDTISKLSFLYSCFDKNHTFHSKMTMFLPFIVDKQSDNYKYELKRLSQAKSIEAEQDSIYSAFIFKDNKITELGSLYYNAYRIMFFESNAFKDVDSSLGSYKTKYSYSEPWKNRLIAERTKGNGFRTKKSIFLNLTLGDNSTHKIEIQENEQKLKKLIYLMTQGKLKRIKDLLEKDPYNAYKTYGEFFKKDYVIPIDISKPEGIEKAKKSIEKYIFKSLSTGDLELLAKFAISPAYNSSNESFARFGSYSTLLSEVKSLRPLEDTTLTDINKVLSLVDSFDAPISSAKDDVNGDNKYTTILRIERELKSYDGYATSIPVTEMTYTRVDTQLLSDGNCRHSNFVERYDSYLRGTGFSASSKFTTYNVSYKSHNFTVTTKGCSTCIQESYARIAKFKELPLLSNDVPDLDDTSLGTYTVSTSEAATAAVEAKNLMKKYPAEYALLTAYFYAELNTSEDTFEYPELGHINIFLARCKYLLDLGYSVSEIESYYEFEGDEINTNSTVLWSDYSLIDYARAAAYGSTNIVFYSKAAFSDFTGLAKDVDFNPQESISVGISDSSKIIDSYPSSPLKVSWPNEINTNGQEQESLTYSKNNINKFIKRTISDNTNKTGDIGIMNLKPNGSSRINTFDESELPDITVSELINFLKGEKAECEKCGFSADDIKEYDIDTTDLEDAASFEVPLATFEDVDKTLYEIYDLQYNQIKEQDDKDNEEPEKDAIKSKAVIETPKIVIIYDLIKQGLTYEEANFFADSILISGVDITGGFVRHPELKYTYGLLNDSYFGTVRELEGERHGSKLAGLVLHKYNLENKDIKDFKIKELYTYDNIDNFLSAIDSTTYETILRKLSIIKNFVELFFSHSDKMLRDLSKIEKFEEITLHGTTYIDDFVDKDKVANALKAVKDSINTTVSTSVEIATVEDNYSEYFKGISDDLKELIKWPIYQGYVYTGNNPPETDEEKENYARELAERASFEQELQAQKQHYDTRTEKFLSELGKYINECIKSTINASSFTIKIDKSDKFDDLTSERAFNLEKYDDSYDRKESTGQATETYKLIDFLPDYAYLYSKPSDGFSIEKKAEISSVNGTNYHNNIVTTVSRKTQDQHPIQRPMFIGDKIEVSEGAYIRGEQLPLPLVSLNIDTEMQNNTQRIEYQPTKGNYYSSYIATQKYGDVSASIVKLTGSFPIIAIGGERFTINSINKIILEGEVFDKLPNGLKTIPKLDVKIVKTWNVQDTVNDGYSKSESSSELRSFEGSRNYKNFIYSIKVSKLGNQAVQLVKAGAECVTLNNNLKSGNILNTVDISEAINSGKERALPRDEDLMREILDNSDLFFCNNITRLDMEEKTVVLNYTVPAADKDLAVEPEITHISKCKYALEY